MTAVCTPISWPEAAVYVVGFDCLTVLIVVAMLCTRSAR